MKLCGYIYHQGTYTPQAGNKKGAGFLPFTGVIILQETVHSQMTVHPVCTAILPVFAFYDIFSADFYAGVFYAPLPVLWEAG